MKVLKFHDVNMLFLEEGEIHFVPNCPTRLLSKIHIGVTVYLLNSFLLGMSSNGQNIAFFKLIAQRDRSLHRPVPAPTCRPCTIREIFIPWPRIIFIMTVRQKPESGHIIEQAGNLGKLVNHLPHIITKTKLVL